MPQLIKTLQHYPISRDGDSGTSLTLNKFTKILNLGCKNISKFVDILGEFYSIHACIISTDEKQVNFIHEQCLKEQQKGYFSKSFGTDLLPGMYAMPIYAVPKPHSTDLCLVTDHSAGFFSLNKMIDHSSVTGFPLDNMLHLGEMLFDIRCTDGNVPLNLWKSDIANTYCLLPMHPLWQIKQIITVDGQRHVDQNLASGSSSSPGIFISFNSLVAWIAKYVKLIKFIFSYINNFSGSKKKGDVVCSLWKWAFNWPMLPPSALGWARNFSQGTKANLWWWTGWCPAHQKHHFSIYYTLLSIPNTLDITYTSIYPAKLIFLFHFIISSILNIEPCWIVIQVIPGISDCFTNGSRHHHLHHFHQHYSLFHQEQFSIRLTKRKSMQPLWEYVTCHKYFLICLALSGFGIFIISPIHCNNLNSPLIASKSPC